MEEITTTEKFEEFIKEGDIIIDYWAEWCAPCRLLKPIFKELSSEMKDVKFAKVDVDNAQDLAGNAAIRGIPTMIMFKDGKEINRMSGFMTKEALKHKIESTFQ